jgi:hypothetical protein
VVVEEDDGLELGAIFTDADAVYEHVAVATDDNMLCGCVVTGDAIRAGRGLKGGSALVKLKGFIVI